MVVGTLAVLYYGMRTDVESHALTLAFTTFILQDLVVIEKILTHLDNKDATATAYDRIWLKLPIRCCATASEERERSLLPATNTT